MVLCSEGYLSSTIFNRNHSIGKVFIAINLYQCESLLRDGSWMRTLMKLIDELGSNNIYLSIFENNSTDATPQLLQQFEKQIKCKHKIVTTKLYLNDEQYASLYIQNGTRRYLSRITYLAMIRNRAIEPILDDQFNMSSNGIRRFSKVLFLNDIFFSSQDAVRLLQTNDGDYAAACALDFINPIKFYDTFATRDAAGYSMGLPLYPYFSPGQSQLQIRQRDSLVHVKSCWSDDNNWIADTVNDFIHSPIWRAPIHTFIEVNCASFDYDDDDDDSTENNEASSSIEEQKNIYKKYQRLVESLIAGLGIDLGLDENELKKVCQLPARLNDSMLAHEPFEQLYSARDFQLFQNMMRRKNLILQLQALVSLQVHMGVLKQGDTSNDRVIALLLQATSSSSRRDSTRLQAQLAKAPVIKGQPQREEQKHKYDDDDDDDDDVVVEPQREPPPPSSSSRKSKPKVEPKKPPKEEYRLPDLRRKGAPDLDAEWHRDLRRQDSKNDDDDSVENDESEIESTPPQTIDAIPEKLLRQKLRDLTMSTTSASDDKTTADIKERKRFLKEQRDKIVNEKRVERERELEQQTPPVRQAMGNASENKQEQQQTQLSNDELKKRRDMMAKIKREVVDKR
ncbi:hypothetical protein I4U23_031134 [Adineta vaga]|nr:hypothetical protein I4U23_031134 [Adineta vaga]